MKYFSLNVASHIANVCEAQNITYNNTKIQKLLYCCYGCSLAMYNKRLCDEYPRAWQFGPVFPRVFSYIKKGHNILTVCQKLDAPMDILALIDEVINTFGRHSATALSTWTHKEGSPWDIVVNAMNDPNGIIPDDLIAEYFIANV
ncbi:MAG: DUF4065 domain-containing protein, partial [Synergistaceae bacterium]|nr:DUF4065 domain-containing protein [Synergistaceae bacterium]